MPVTLQTLLARGTELGHNDTTDCARAWRRTGSYWCSRVQPFVRQSPHRKLCPLGQAESAQAARYTRDVRRTEHQVPGIDNASHANAGSRPGILYSDARSRLRETGPTDFILLTRPPLCHYTLTKGEGGAYHSYRRAGVFVDTDPTVEVGALVEMDPDSKYPKATLIRGRKSMQSIAIGGASLLPTAALAAPGFS